MRILLTTFFCVLLMVTSIRIPSSNAAFGTDMDKPAPVFTREDDAYVATLIPRGKSTKIDIRFTVSPGTLANVEGMDFESAKDDSVDIKDFRSALFVIKAEGVPTGAEARVSIRSQYFTGSTQYWVYNKYQSQLWRNSAAKNTPLGNSVYDLVISVKDGGPMDSDGLANGSIILVGGPLDSFWGYALGTLFIRFFGIFLVLTILMLGMLGSSRIFQLIERRQSENRLRVTPVDAEPSPTRVSPEMAAAIGLAVHMHLGRIGRPPRLSIDAESTAWVSQGRVISMDGRFGMYDRMRNIEK